MIVGIVINSSKIIKGFTKIDLNIDLSDDNEKWKVAIMFADGEFIPISSYLELIPDKHGIYYSYYLKKRIYNGRNVKYPKGDYFRLYTKDMKLYPNLLKATVSKIDFKKKYIDLTFSKFYERTIDV